MNTKVKDLICGMEIDVKTAGQRLKNKIEIYYELSLYYIEMGQMNFEKPHIPEYDYSSDIKEALEIDKKSFLFYSLQSVGLNLKVKGRNIWIRHDEQMLKPTDKEPDL